MSEEKTVSRRSAQLLRLSDAVDENELETQAALFEYVFSRASNDSGLSADQVMTFQHVQQQHPVTRESQAALVGKRLAELGDEIDAQYHDEMEEIVQLSGSPETAMTMFHEVVKNLFEWDEYGAARINIGRIAALLAYCYHLAKTYLKNNLQSNMTAYGLLSFLTAVGGWLFQFLLKAKFYEWLGRQGGWGELLTLSTAGWGKHVFLFIGVTSILIWAYSYLRGK